jgi:hypothetical protein
MGIVAQSIARLRYKVPRVSPVRSPARQAPSAEYRFDTDECPRQAQSLTRQSLDQAELIALSLSLSWQIVIVKTKSTGFTPKTRELRKMADRTSSAAGTDCSSGFELETRSSATNHDDSGGIVAERRRPETRIPGADCRSSRASPVRQIS